MLRARVEEQDLAEVFVPSGSDGRRVVPKRLMTAVDHEVLRARTGLDLQTLARGPQRRVRAHREDAE